MKYDGHIIVVGDLGQLKAYRVSNITGVDRHETMQVSHAQKRGTERESTKLELIFDTDYLEAHSRVSEQMSDKAGNQKNASGEPHNAALQQESSILKQISSDIAAIIREESPAMWHLAFPKATSKKLNEKLDPQVKQTLKKCVAADLTKIDKNRLISHFE